MCLTKTWRREQAHRILSRNTVARFAASRTEPAPKNEDQRRQIKYVLDENLEEGTGTQDPEQEHCGALCCFTSGRWIHRLKQMHD
jgi:hypothetical protein